MRVIVVNNHTMHLQDIKKLFAPTDNLEYISYTQIWWYDFGGVDCIVLTGSSNHPYYSKTFDKELAFLQEVTTPTIGICLGCELMVEAFGGIIHRQTERIEGKLDIQVENDPATYVVHEAHRYSIVHLWDELHGVAKSEYGYEIIKHISKPFIGFQFHPEVMTESKDGYRLFAEYTKDFMSKPKIYIHHNDWFDDWNHYAFMSHRISSNSWESA